MYTTRVETSSYKFWNKYILTVKLTGLNHFCLRATTLKIISFVSRSKFCSRHFYAVRERGNKKLMNDQQCLSFCNFSRDGQLFCQRYPGSIFIGFPELCSCLDKYTEFYGFHWHWTSVKPKFSSWSLWPDILHQCLFFL